MDKFQESHANAGSIPTAPRVSTLPNQAQHYRLYQDLLQAIATHRVADRPDRSEPRAKKRRRNHYNWLTKPRQQIKRKMAKGLTEN